jgi:hypothetical protein
MLKRRCCSAALIVSVCGALIPWVKIASTTAEARLDTVVDENHGRETVTLIMHSIDANGNPVPPSSLKVIEVTEHGEKLQIVSGPQSLGLEQIAFVVDSNFHQKDVLQLEKDTVENLLSRFENREVRAFVMNYGTGIQTSGALTGDLNSLRTFTRSVRADTDKRNETILLFDALKQAIDALSVGSGNKAIILFAEGNGYGNFVRPQTLAPLAQQKHIACYVVLFADHSCHGPKGILRYGWDLVDLAAKTGGKFWEVGNNHRKAERITDDIVRETSSQVMVEIVPRVSRTHGFHRVKVSSSGRRLQAQTGYFDGSH